MPSPPAGTAPGSARRLSASPGATASTPSIGPVVAASGARGISTTSRSPTRRARCGDETRYYYTEKTRVTAVTRIEREHEITAAEFEALLSERDEALRTIEKTRYLVPFEGHTLEIDVFPFWRDRAFCECELQSEDEPLPLPDWLHVYREVTDDPRYTNRALARSVPDEIL